VIVGSLLDFKIEQLFGHTSNQPITESPNKHQITKSSSHQMRETQLWDVR